MWKQVLHEVLETGLAAEHQEPRGSLSIGGMPTVCGESGSGELRGRGPAESYSSDPPEGMVVVWMFVVAFTYVFGGKLMLKEVLDSLNRTW